MKGQNRTSVVESLKEQAQRYSILLERAKGFYSSGLELTADQQGRLKRAEQDLKALTAIYQCVERKGPKQERHSAPYRG